MLVLTRKKGQTIMIEDKIEVTVLDIKGDQIRIGITAPKEVTILRKELYLEILEENRAALQTGERDLDRIAELIKKSV